MNSAAITDAILNDLLLEALQQADTIQRNISKRKQSEQPPPVKEKDKVTTVTPPQKETSTKSFPSLIPLPGRTTKPPVNNKVKTDKVSVSNYVTEVLQNAGLQDKTVADVQSVRLDPDLFIKMEKQRGDIENQQIHNKLVFDAMNEIVSLQADNTWISNTISHTWLNCS
jgi:hypothetical protein